MTADLARLTAAQAKADEVIGAIAEPLDGGPLLRIAVADAATGQRLATGFVAYKVGTPQLTVVAP